ncbi:uncharacterized protein LOC127738354 [Mytilus californianus]|uniref:uncharacterized protein LOC127738354 n=1 Tax=Mytilus californianus TaxID=6549 RepID=UPI0022468F0A|nr:uncharacterized protein LOC127738354 [Mytilus californianus]
MATSKPSHSQISSRVDQYERLSNTHSYLPNRGNNSRQSGQQVTGRQSQSWSHDRLSHHRPENQNDMLSGDRIEEARLQSMHIPIHAAAYEGNVERLEALINTGVNINFQAIRHKYKVTPLMIAASRGLLEVVRLLIQKGAEIDKLDNFKRPALMYAVFSGSLPVVYYLILHGSDVNHVDSSGYAPIHYTAISGHLQILKLLFHEGGANKTIPSQNNMGSPLMIARMRGHQDIVDFLMNDDASDRNPTTNRVLPSAPPIDNGISHGQVEENVPGITRPSAPPYSEVSQTSPTAPVLDDITASNLPTYDEVVSPGMPQGACGGQNIQTNSLFVPGDLPPPPSYQEVITNKVTYGITPWISEEGSNSLHNVQIQERFDRFMRRFDELMNFVASMSSEIEADFIPTDLNVAERLVKTHFDRKVKIEVNFHRFKENHNEFITNGRCNLDDIKDKLKAVAEEENTIMKMFTVYMYEYDICVKCHRLWITIDTLLDKAVAFKDLFTSIVLSETGNALMGQRQQIAELDENLSSLKEEEKIVNEDFQRINRIHSLDYESRKIDFEVLSSQISSQLHQVADYFENLQKKFKDKQLLFETKIKSFTQNKTWVHGYFCSTAETGICSQIQICIDSGVNINLQNQKGMTALHIAASKGHINFVRELLDRGADINSETTFGSSVLCEASKQKQINVVKLLIDRGAEIKAKYKMTGKSALHIACLNGYWDIVKLMVEKDKSVINDAPINGNPPLHYAAEEGNITMVNYLLDHGADENLLKNMNGEFPYKEDIVNCLCIDQSEDEDDANYDGARGTSLANDRNPHQSSKGAVGQTQPLSTPLSSSPLKSEQVIHKGILQRKHDMKSKTVKSFARKWVPMYGTLRGHEMYCRSYEIGDLGIYEKLKLPQHPVISLINAEVHHVDNYKRKKYVFRILLQNGGSFLFKTHSLDNMKLWLEKIQEAIYHEPTVDSIKLQPNKN